MKGILREEFWRAFHNKRFWLVAILAGITLTHGLVRTLAVYSAPEGSGTLNSFNLWLGTLGIGYFPYFAVVMAAETMGIILRVCCREATSGTIPP